jgi:hypothetical protein
MNAVSIQCPKYDLSDKWNIYYHLPDNKKWDLNSYTTIFGDIKCADEVIALNKTIPDGVISKCMLFLMRDNIAPMWEDPKNRRGGCFSYRILNKNVPNVWRELVYLCCGETLILDKKYSNHVNGITISPKKNFCIIKIWLDTTSIKDPECIRKIENLPVQGCLFKKHEPEF